MKIAVLGGGGALGGLFGGKLAAGGHEVTLIDVSAAAVERISNDGLRIVDFHGTEQRIDVAATTDPGTVGKVDLVIVLVKGQATQDAVRQTTGLAGPDTVYLTLQNGWGHAARIAEIVGEDRVLAGLTYQAANLLAPGRVRNPRVERTIIGRLDGKTTGALELVVDAFNHAGVETHLSPNIVAEIWRKLTLNVCSLPIGMIVQETCEILMASRSAAAIMRGMVKEVAAVAHAIGLEYDEEARWEEVERLMHGYVGVKPSMLQDREARRLTEIDFVNGAVVAEGAARGVPTPINWTMVQLVKTIEQQYAPSR